MQWRSSISRIVISCDCKNEGSERDYHPYHRVDLHKRSSLLKRGEAFGNEEVQADNMQAKQERHDQRGNTEGDQSRGS